MPKARLNRLKRCAASMDKYAGHISRSLYQGLSSTSLVNSRMTLRTGLAGRSVTGPETASEAIGSLEQRTRSASSRTAYVRPRASWPQAHRLPFAWNNASDSGTASWRAPDASRASIADGELTPATIIRRCDAGDCAAFGYLRAGIPRSVNDRANSSVAHCAAPEDAIASNGSTTIATPSCLPAASADRVAARAAAPAAVRRNWRRLSF